MTKEIVGNNISNALAGGERKVFSDADSDSEFIDRIFNDHGFRFQLSQLLTTYNISNYRIDDLGYESRPFVEVSYFINHLNLEHLNDEQMKLVARAVLEASIEVRDELSALFGAIKHHDSSTSRGDYVAALPFPMQVVVLAKACAGHSGSVLYPSSLSRDSDERSVLKEYISNKFAYSPEKADKVLDAIVTVHGAAILAKHFDYGFESEAWRELGDFPASIVGEPAPRMGYYLPDNIEEALRRSGIQDLWRIDYLGAEWRAGDEAIESDRKLISGLEWLSDRVIELSNRPEGERPFWKAYVITTMLAEQAFEGRSVSGYAGDYDQLATWKEPKPDRDFKEAYVALIARLEKYGLASGELDSDGMLLSLKGYAMRIGRQAEREVVFGSSNERDGRLKVIADIHKELRKVNPKWAQDLIASLPLIGGHIEELSDPWQYRFD